MITKDEPNTETLLSELRSIKDRGDELAEEQKKLSERRQQIEYALMDFHKTTGLASFSGAGISVFFDDEAMRATYDPEKWNEVCEWAVKTGNQHIIQRRLTDSKVLDLIDAGVALPAGLGVESYVKISIRRK